uniref:ORF43k n=1 Tax=Pinus koraiensis TaxID=88728 RepID=A4QM87_PINKO|nr:ORF43k [Pinus koraiensis]ABP35424.1 ORF43k [Pinus koraiensis]
MLDHLLKIGVYRNHITSYHEQIVSTEQIWARSIFVFLEYQKQA